MTDNERPFGDHGILELIATLSAKGASGRLEVLAGATAGALLFRNGKLADARMGHLSGFQALNAIVSMPEAGYRFDPSVAPPVTSAITPSERLVLKQFFGIETADSHDYAVPVSGNDFVAPVNEVATHISGNEVEETTVIKSDGTNVLAATAAATNVVATDAPIRNPDAADAPVTNVPAAEAPVPNVPPADAPLYASRSWFPYVAAFALGVLVIAIAGGAVFLRGEFRERSAKAAVATVEPAVATESPVVNEVRTETQAPTSVNEQAAAPQKATAATIDEKSAPVATNEKPAPSAGTDTTAPTTTDPNATANLTGTWNVVNTVRTTSYKSFQNLQIGFIVSINQTGSTFTATGQKVSENGRSLPASSRTPIQLKGVIHGDRVEATFVEAGAARKTNGKIIWKLNRAGGGLTGTFASTAARTSGKSTARRNT